MARASGNARPTASQVLFTSNSISISINSSISTSVTQKEFIYLIISNGPSQRNYWAHCILTSVPQVLFTSISISISISCTIGQQGLSLIY